MMPIRRQMLDAAWPGLLYSNPILFAQNLCHSRIEYSSNAIDLCRKNRAPPPLSPSCRFLGSTSRKPACKPMKPAGWPPARSGTILRLGEKRARGGCSAYASQSDSTNLSAGGSIFKSPINRDLRFAATGLSGLG